MSFGLTTSPPWLVLSARQTAMLTASLTNTTWPSQKTVLTPPGECRLRAAIIRGRALLLVVVHGMRHVAATLQMPPIRTSGALALGGFQVVKPLAPPHQVKPRRSFDCPWIVSAAISVFAVPSLIVASATCG